MNAKDAILYLYDKGLLNIDTIMKNKDSIMQELDNTTEKLTKHDPTRLFKKGDEVRVVAWNGRDIARIGQIGRVVSDEHNSRVELAIDGWTSSVYYPACHLELVTPVEELEPYSVHAIVGDNGKTAFFAVRNGDVTVAAFFCDTSRAFTEEQARAGAEAERDRLNAEWRKEQNND